MSCCGHPLSFDGPPHVLGGEDHGLERETIGVYGRQSVEETLGVVAAPAGVHAGVLKGGREVRLLCTLRVTGWLKL